MAFCSNCGTQMAEDAKFCPSCGTTIGGVMAGSSSASHNDTLVKEHEALALKSERELAMKQEFIIKLVKIAMPSLVALGILGIIFYWIY